MGKFKRIKYPDGQISAEWENSGANFNSITNSVIYERINSYEDLFFVRACAEVLQKWNVKGRLRIPCMFGQRSDRRFSNFQSFDLKLITDIINECNFEEVEIFDPHSDVTLALINKSVKRSSLEFVQQTVSDIQVRQLLNDGYTTDLLLVSPDAGAYKKVFEYGERLNLPTVGAMKHRDKYGKISLVFTHDVEEKDCLIVDDLCDGGYTFELLSKALKEHKARNVYLYVSHGLFSKGFKELSKTINHIYCTNSVSDLSKFYDEEGTIITVNDRPETDFITQYKII